MTQTTLTYSKRIDSDNIRYSGIVNHNGEEAIFNCQYIISSNSAHIDEQGEKNINALGIDANDIRDQIETRKVSFN